MPLQGRPGGQLHDHRNEVKQSRDAGVDELCQNPVDGEVQHLTNAQQIDERPQQRGNERGDGHEEEPVRGANVRGRRERHADDAENLVARWDIVSILFSSVCF